MSLIICHVCNFRLMAAKVRKLWQNQAAKWYWFSTGFSDWAIYLCSLRRITRKRTFKVLFQYIYSLYEYSKTGLEPAHPFRIPDSKSGVSTNSTTLGCWCKYTSFIWNIQIILCFFAINFSILLFVSLISFLYDFYPIPREAIFCLIRKGKNDSEWAPNLCLFYNFG